MSDPETEPKTEDTPKPARPVDRGVRPPGVLQKDTDRPARPGFREPPNKKSKAQKKKRK